MGSGTERDWFLPRVRLSQLEDFGDGNEKETRCCVLG